MKRFLTLLILILASSVSATHINSSNGQSQPCLDIISGNEQTAVVNTLLAPFTVRYTQDGTPLENHIIIFKRVTGKVTFQSRAEIITVTDRDGYARVSARLGKTAYMQNEILVKSQHGQQTCTFYCYSQPDVVDSICVMSELPDSGLPNQVLGELHVRIIDQFHNPIRECPVRLQLKNGDCFIDDMPFVSRKTDMDGSVRARIQLGHRLVESEIIVEAGPVFRTIRFSTIPTSVSPDLKRSSIHADSPVLPDGQSSSNITVNICNELGQPLSGIPVTLVAHGKSLSLYQHNELSDKDGKIRAEVRSTIPQTVILNAFVEDNRPLEQFALIEFCAKDLKVSGLNSTPISGTVGALLVEPLKLKLSLNEKPLAGQIVIFSSQAHGASFGQSSRLETRTDSSGVCSAYFQCGSIAESQTVFASPAIAPNKTCVFEITAQPAETHTLANKFSNIPITFTETSLPMPLGVTARDAFQNRVSGDSIYFSALDGGSLTCNQPIVSNSAGEAFATAAVGQRSGIYTFKAESKDGAMVLIRVQAMQQETPTDAVDERIKPTTFHLYPNHPNPFNAGTRITFDCPKTEHVCLEIWDINGRFIDSLVDKRMHPGQHTVQWNASALPSGAYICRFTTPHFTTTRKMLYLR